MLPQARRAPGPPPAAQDGSVCPGLRARSGRTHAGSTCPSVNASLGTWAVGGSARRRPGQRSARSSRTKAPVSAAPRPIPPRRRRDRPGWPRQQVGAGAEPPRRPPASRPCGRPPTLSLGRDRWQAGVVAHAARPGRSPCPHARFSRPTEPAGGSASPRPFRPDPDAHGAWPPERVPCPGAAALPGGGHAARRGARADRRWAGPGARGPRARRQRQHRRPRRPGTAARLTVCARVARTPAVWTAAGGKAPERITGGSLAAYHAP